MTLIYCSSSLDKSNLGNAKTLGMIKDIGGDPTGEKYAFFELAVLHRLCSLQCVHSNCLQRAQS